MMGGPLVLTARVLAVADGPEGRLGRVSVRGATLEVALDLVPDARVGDSVLVHAGVALSLVRDETAAAASDRSEQEA